jgi:splicing factor 3B subunit 3
VGCAAGGPQDDGLPSQEEKQVGYPRAPSWAGALRILDPSSNKTHQLVELDADEVGVALEVVVFADRGADVFLAVGTVVGFNLHPASGAGETRVGTEARIRVYRFVAAPHTQRLELVSVTKVHDVPSSLCAFDGRLLAGVGTSLVLYDLGLKQLLRKCELKGARSCLVCPVAR